MDVRSVPGWTPWMALPLTVALGCGGGGEPSPSETPTAACEVAPLSQPSERFPIGQTFWLKTTGDCSGATWELTSAPAANENSPVTGADGGYGRFTPLVAGSYTLTLSASGESVTFTAVDDSDWPFHNYNYYGSRSMAVVGDELWVANVYRPTVTRIRRSNLEVEGEMRVGAWPVALAAVPGQERVVVAHRGSDTLGIIDTREGRLVDAVWVGDEPANVVVTPDGEKAYVALPTQHAVAVVDLNERTLLTTIPAVRDPLGLALSPLGDRLYVASHRSGHPDRYPYEADPVEEERDIAVIKTITDEVLVYFLDVGTTTGDLKVSADGSLLYVATLQNDPSLNLADPEDLTFVHEVVVLKADTGTRVGGADLSRQASSGGYAVTLHGMVLEEDALWVTAEGSDVVIKLDPESLEERGRYTAEGRPRDVVVADGEVWVHGSQGLRVTGLTTDGSDRGAVTTTTDPRPQTLAEGQRYFTGAGRDYGANWSCNSCHLDGLGDTLIWNAGPFENRIASRPFTWLESTWPLGWAGYLSNVVNYAYTVNTNVGIRPTTEEAQNLATYIASIMPPPAANAWTERDGALSESGLRGKAIYEGKGACAGCHPMPLTTNRQVLSEGVTFGVSDTPTLIGSYRHNLWMKHGEARTLEDAVAQTVAWLGVSLTEEERLDLTDYVRQLTGRDFFLMTSEPRPGASGVPADRPIELTFSFPVMDSATNLEKIRLADAGGSPIDVEVQVDGRHVTLVPERALSAGAIHQVSVEQGLMAFDGRLTPSAASVSFTTADAGELRLAGDYVWTVYVPSLDFESGEFDPSVTIPVPSNLAAVETSAGADLVLDYTQDLVYPTWAVVDGRTLRTPPLPVPVGPSFSDSTGMAAELIDEDGDGVGDFAQGTLVMTGPGFVVEDVVWELTRPLDPNACEEGASGNPAVTVTRDEEGRPFIEWASVNALGVYVTDPAATLPLGPSQVVSNGNAYWVLGAVEFPAGFAGPATYGVVPEGAYDDTERHGGPAGGAALEPGKCYKFAVTGTNFSTGQVIMRW